MQLSFVQAEIMFLEFSNTKCEKIEGLFATSYEILKRALSDFSIYNKE